MSLPLLSLKDSVTFDAATLSLSPHITLNDIFFFYMYDLICISILSHFRLSEQSLAQPSDQYRPAVVKPVIYKHRAEWDLTSPHNYTAKNNASKSPIPVSTLENGSRAGPIYPESYFTMNYNQQQHFQNQPKQICMLGTIKTLELSTQCLPSNKDQSLPYETDIDEFPENEGTAVEQQRQAEDSTEMQCFAQPVTVLETDIDTLTDEEALSSGMRRGQRASIVDSLLEEGCGRAGKELMGELFPHYAGSGTEGWRGGNILSGDMVERYDPVFEKFGLFAYFVAF